MAEGILEWFNDARGFGLIREKGSERSCYVLFDAFDGDIPEAGARVAFERARRGTVDVAVRVRPLSGGGAK